MAKNVTFDSIEQFSTACVKLGSKFADAAALLHVYAIIAVNKAYGSTDEGGHWVAALLNAMPQYARRTLRNYLFRVGGLNIPELAHGAKEYAIPADCVLDRSKQALHMEKVRTTPVYAVEVKEGRKPRVKTLNGTVQERANKAIESAITRLKKDDPEAGAVLNEMFTMARAMCLYTQDGTRVALTREQLEVVTSLIDQWDDKGGFVVEVPPLKLAA